MVEKPDKLIPDFARAGVDNITVHVETCPHLNRTIGQIKDFGLRAGFTLNPSTTLISLEEILPFVDLVLIMSVNPGFGGQVYPQHSTHRPFAPDAERGRADHVELQVDGGVSDFWRDHTGQAPRYGGTRSSAAGGAKNIAALRRATRFCHLSVAHLAQTVIIFLLKTIYSYGWKILDANHTFNKIGKFVTIIISYLYSVCLLW
jgi:hypothetical protein